MKQKQSMYLLPLIYLKAHCLHVYIYIHFYKTRKYTLGCNVDALSLACYLKVETNESYLMED